jgi:HEAT repeat protein
MGLPAQPAVPALVEALQDESEWVRRNAADSLGNIGQPASRTAQPALVEALDDNRKVSRWSLSDSPFRENAVVALAKMGELSPLAIRALERALTDENEYIRSWAAVALGVPEE